MSSGATTIGGSALGVFWLTLWILLQELWGLIFLLARPAVCLAQTGLVAGLDHPFLHLVTNDSTISNVWISLCMAALLGAYSTCRSASGRACILLFLPDAVWQTVQQVLRHTPLLPRISGTALSLPGPPLGLLAMHGLPYILLFAAGQETWRNANFFEYYHRLSGALSMHALANLLRTAGHDTSAMVSDATGALLVMYAFGSEAWLQRLWFHTQRFLYALRTLWNVVSACVVRMIQAAWLWCQTILLWLAPWVLNRLVVRIWNTVSPFALPIVTATLTARLARVATIALQTPATQVHGLLLLVAMAYCAGVTAMLLMYALGSNPLRKPSQFRSLQAVLWVFTLTWLWHWLCEYLLSPVLCFFGNQLETALKGAQHYPRLASLLVLGSNTALFLTVDATTFLTRLVARLRDALSGGIVEVWANISNVQAESIPTNPLFLTLVLCFGVYGSHCCLKQCHIFLHDIRVEPRLGQQLAFERMVSAVRGSFKAVAVPTMIQIAMEGFPRVSAALMALYWIAWVLYRIADNEQPAAINQVPEDMREPVDFHPRHARGQRVRHRVKQPAPKAAHASLDTVIATLDAPVKVYLAIDDTCGICLDRLLPTDASQTACAILDMTALLAHLSKNGATALPCGHCLHRGCLWTFLASAETIAYRCMFCRAPLTYRHAMAATLFA